MGRKGNPHALLVGMQAGTATVENNMNIPQKFKNRTALQLLFWATMRNLNMSLRNNVTLFPSTHILRPY